MNGLITGISGKKGRKNMKMTLKKKVEFLEALARTGSVTRAAQAAGVDRSTLYRLKEREPAFARAWDRQSLWSEELFTVEERAIKRASLGSDSMIRFVLKDYAPRLYGVDGLEDAAGTDTQSEGDELASMMEEMPDFSEKQSA